MSRIDKYLWAVRLCKNRNLSLNLIKSNKVHVNKEEVKASKIVKTGDEISIKKYTAVYTYRVIKPLERRVGASLVKNYIEDITPAKEIEKFKIYQLAQRNHRQNGFGKPSKKDKRTLNKYLKNEQ